MTMGLPSVFEILKPAVGPSSSHTLGPMLAARAFVEEIAQLGASELARRAAAAGRARGGALRIRVELFGSLALTGRGHLTDLAVAAGLAGFGPRELASTSLRAAADGVARAGRISVGEQAVPFDPADDIVFCPEERELRHPNTMRFSLIGADGEPRLCETYYSIGGGRLAGGTFGDLAQKKKGQASTSTRALLAECGREKIDLVEYVYRTEEQAHGRQRWEVDAHADEMWDLMMSAMERGLAAAGTLPGHLGLERRAKSLYESFLGQLPHFHVISPEASLAAIYAIAVAEENASGGSVVTAPTCGSCGVVPAALRMVQEKMDFHHDEIRGALLVAGLIGSIVAANASISGAEVGCQGEIGAASAMAAGAVCHLLGGSVEDQLDRAAESALEHYLGLTCDPVDGLVQIPCIERNAAGAVSALNAASLAMISRGRDRVPFDAALDAMLRTGRDLDARYRETSLGGLATSTGIED